MTRDYDVVVAGSGAGGLVGALRAASHGLSVLVLEKAAECGGTTALSGAGLWAPANMHVLAAGQPDSLDLAREYMSHTVGDRAPQELQDAYLAAAAETINWLESQDVRFNFMRGYPDYHPELPGALLTGRAVTPKAVSASYFDDLEHPVVGKLPQGDGGPPMPVVPDYPVFGGRAMIGMLLSALAKLGVEVWTSSPFLDVVVEDGRVVGVTATHDGQALTIRARRGVLLASGGFDHNTALRAQFCHEPVKHDRWSLGVAGDTGDGITAGMKLGAATDLMEDCWWAPGVVRPDGGPSFLLYERAAPTGIVVDQAGSRWVNEGVSYNWFGHLMLDALERGVPCLPSWYVFDDHAFRRYGFAGLRPDEDPTPWVEAGAMKRADTIEELAAQLGTPALSETVERWNTLVDKGVDEDFDRGAEGSYERQLLWMFQRYPGLPGAHEWLNPSLAPVTQGPF
ncbi:MAG: FAD-dependent oxidoreductase, partial [Actinomycetota bacterium]|nr:FAD-dependent oxidoreductase [Actinomycetota bacterium]